MMINKKKNIIGIHRSLGQFIGKKPDYGKTMYHILAHIHVWVHEGSENIIIGNHV